MFKIHIYMYNSFNPHNNPMRKGYYFSNFAYEETYNLTKARGSKRPNWDLNTGGLAPKPNFHF